MEQTANYHLSQWKGEDRILVEDFNADTAKVDAALKAEAEVRRTADEAETRARTAAVSSLSAAPGKRGNCKIWTTSYQGTGTAGPSAPTSLTFPKKPVVAAIADGNGALYWLLPRDGWMIYDRASNVLRWSGSTATWYCRDNEAYTQLNISGATYHVFALISMD